MPAVFPPYCRSSSAKCFLLGHHFLCKIALYGYFLKPTDSILIELRDKFSPLNYAQYDGLDLQNGDRIATIDM